MYHPEGRFQKAGRVRMDGDSLLTHGVVSFGSFRLFAAERQLKKGDEPLQLGSRALDTLMVLVERAGEVVTQRELISRVWPDVTVEEANLRVNIASLRKSQRVRQAVILAVGAVWKSNYELYAHAAAARKAGIPEDAIRTLTAGGLPDELSDQEKIAQRFARQLSAEHHIDAALYSAAEKAFGWRGLVEIAYRTGAYHTVCALLNAFEIPAPR
jgi:alkylhydroperoxidase family enzyme